MQVVLVTRQALIINHNCIADTYAHGIAVVSFAALQVIVVRIMAVQRIVTGFAKQCVVAPVTV